jgi:hypothetical protein
MKRVVLITCIAVVAACNKGPDISVKNASVGEVAEKVREAAADQTLVKPGRWESKITLLEVEAPGLPPQYAQQMKQTIGKAQGGTVTTCLTEADIKKPKEDFFAGRSKNCRYDHFTMSGGKIDAQMNCTTGDRGGTMSMAINGTYSAESYEATMAMNMAGGEGRMSGMKMKSHTESRRVGACKGDEINFKRERVGQ